ncbi:MAG: hypothetical protein KGK16_01715 [Bradyrhizobium sp.]|uniref:hypothetical protein n=1 Tax=Bradyrhizobium sp. TaxID=376 RepID=UPI0023A2BA8B|nr:hypothetical protein [Bradyrhizobium sp.]MDE2329494.1 hypothetical protein [Bradyrhizobium sp.]MDE2602765.1 hypothetical protein [Bradyrhizobium sp.]
MSVYRVYVIGKGGHIDGFPHYIECTDDNEAIQRARRMVDGHSVEIWEGARIVKKLVPET